MTEVSADKPHQVNTPGRSTARVNTDRPARYGKQLASHFGAKSNAFWSTEEARGSITFVGEGSASENPKRAFDGTVQVDLVAGDNVLLMHVECPTELQERFENVVGGHLVRFGTKDNLIVEWRRADGQPGTTQKCESENTEQEQDKTDG